jgi:SAM-dependent methyltransferase
MPKPTQSLGRLDDLYHDGYTREVDEYRRMIAVFLDQIFERYFALSIQNRTKTYRQWCDPSSHPSPVAAHYSGKLLAYYLDRGLLDLDKDGYPIMSTPIIDPDPEDAMLADYLRRYPERTKTYRFLCRIRDHIQEVIFGGEDALLAMANNDFHEAMALWEDLMINAHVKTPCHKIVCKALTFQLQRNERLTVFEGGAGVGTVLREAVQHRDAYPGCYENLGRIDRYLFTDISLSLIKIGRERLKALLPSSVYDRIEFKVVDLEKLGTYADRFLKSNSMDVVIMESVLYNVADLNDTLGHLHRILKPGGVLIFSMFFRTRPRDFFYFEYMHSTFQSYYRGIIDPGYRDHIGYLTTAEWEKCLKRAGFDRYEVYPSPEDHVRWPCGGMIAYPSK